MTSELSLEDWLSSTQSRRNELDDFARSPLPIGNDAYGETNKLIESEDDANRLLADAESFLTQYTAKAVLGVRARYPDSSADERKIHIKDSVRTIQRLVDGIQVTARSIANRRFITMNVNRSR